MIKVSRNIVLGEPIADVLELARLADERKSVVWCRGIRYNDYCVRPASFFLGWPLRTVLNAKIHYAIKIWENEIKGTK